jgi:hypothetical protein
MDALMVNIRAGAMANRPVYLAVGVSLDSRRSLRPRRQAAGIDRSAGSSVWRSDSGQWWCWLPEQVAFEGGGDPDFPLLKPPAAAVDEGPEGVGAQDHSLYVVSGTVHLQIGDQFIEAPAGSYVIKPRGLPHSF